MYGLVEVTFLWRKVVPDARATRLLELPGRANVTKPGSARRVGVDRLAGPPFCDGTVGLWLSRPKVISPELVSPETRDMSPEIFIQVARNFILLSNIFA